MIYLDKLKQYNTPTKNQGIYGGDFLNLPHHSSDARVRWTSYTQFGYLPIVLMVKHVLKRLKTTMNRYECWLNHLKTINNHCKCW